MRGETVRDLVAGAKTWARAAIDRVHPGMVMAVGLAVVAPAVGGVGLAILGDDGRGLDDLDLGAPSVLPPDGDGTTDAVDGVTSGGGDPLAVGLTERERAERSADPPDHGAPGDATAVARRAVDRRRP